MEECEERSHQGQADKQELPEDGTQIAVGIDKRFKKLIDITENPEEQNLFQDRSFMEILSTSFPLPFHGFGCFALQKVLVESVTFLFQL